MTRFTELLDEYLAAKKHYDALKDNPRLASAASELLELRRKQLDKFFVSLRFTAGW